ncbi:hypothetical protein [Brevibacillus brevis]|uniref:hypothetical protein n=1 Tax=Brevibacillus brevis TaxID=1393 RepID=UPI001C8E9658|nr:hypothetical protein [Brevibacillus brevis]MBY0087435.1 hypothetical protein [Brevibacillus brevis]
MSKDKPKDNHQDSFKKETIFNEKHKQAEADMNDLIDTASPFFRIPSHQNLFTLGSSHPDIVHVGPAFSP